MSKAERPLRHLSASSISAFLECPMAFYGRYVFRWPEQHPPFMVRAMRLGAAVHSALEAFHLGRDPIAALLTQWPRDLDADAYPVALGLVRLYTSTQERDPRDRTEHKFSVRVPGVDLPVIGYIDLVRGLTIREFKTTSSSTWWTQERVDTALQTTVYSVAMASANHGAQCAIEYHVLNHREVPQTHTILTTTRNKADREAGCETIRQAWSDMQKGELNAVCAPGKCRFPTQCREYGYVGLDSEELRVDTR